MEFLFLIVYYARAYLISTKLSPAFKSGTNPDKTPFSNLTRVF